MISAVLAIAVLMAGSEPAAAQTAGAPAAAAASGAPPVVKVRRNEDLLCREEQVIGSKIPKKVCYTREQQEDRTRQDQDNLNRMQSQMGTNSH